MIFIGPQVSKCVRLFFSFQVPFSNNQFYLWKYICTFPVGFTVLCVTATQTGMNAAIRAVTRMGIYVGAQVYLIYEVNFFPFFFFQVTKA